MTTFLLAIVLCAWGGDDSAGDAQEKARREEVVRIAAEKVRGVAILSGAAESQTELCDKPLLHWSNPTIGSIYGDVYLWSHAGRPVAVGSVYRWFHPLVKQPTLEVTSLSPSAVQGREERTTIWRSRKAGVTFQALADAPPAGDSAPVRLRQMRSLAVRFTATLSDDRDDAEVDRQLRLLNQPLHRYNSAEHKISDGSLFAFVEGTDPEVWLLIEAAEDKSWRYALARMNSSALAVSLDDKVVRRFDKIKEAWKNQDAVYTLISFTPRPVDDAR